MKKYYAKQISGDWFDCRPYLDDDRFSEVWAGGNRYYANINDDLRWDIDSALCNCQYDCEDVRDGFSNEDNVIEDIAGYEAELSKTIRHYFKKDNKEELTAEEEHSLLVFCERYELCAYSSEKYDIIAQVLTILKGKEFVTRQISGCSQSDWMYIIYPKDIEESIPYYEAVIFNTGSEWEVTEEPIESSEDFDNVDHISFYTEKFKDSDIKQIVANDCGVSVEEVALLKISGSHTYTEYDYKEI